MARMGLLSLHGDGIGPEITAATENVLTAVAAAQGFALDLTRMDIGLRALEAHGSTIPDPVVEAARSSDGVILGPVSHHEYPPVSDGGHNPSSRLRTELELYANIRPARVWPGVEPAIQGPVDLVVVRENLEGFYADRNMYQGSGEFMPVPGVALAIRRITAEGSLRIARKAFEIAHTRPEKRVTAIHKANVLRLSDGLFLDTVRSVAAEHPDIAYEELLVDAAAALLVRNPERFDVLVTTNMFGDILSDLASELTGSLGLAGSLNVGSNHAAAQAQHGSAPDIAGQDIANPTSLILSSAMLLEHLGLAQAARQIVAAVGSALEDPATRTADLGGSLGTREFTRVLVDIIERTSEAR